MLSKKHTRKKIGTKTKYSYKLSLLLALLLGFGLIFFAVHEFRQKYQATHNPNPEVKNETVTHSTDTPDETPPKCSEYQVAPDQPRRIISGSVDISGCIQRVGVDQYNAVAVPQNIFVAGWFINSVKPGDVGLSIIDGHVHGKYSTAIFTNLKDLRPGDKFDIEFGDFSLKKFEVVRTNSYSPQETAIKMLRKDDEISNQLNLITCGGNFDRGSQQYYQRILVVSKLAT